MKINQTFVLKILILAIGLPWISEARTDVTPAYFGLSLGQSSELKGTPLGNYEVPSADYSLSLRWLEPFLGNGQIGSRVLPGETFLSSRSRICLTPWSGKVSTGIGIRPLPFVELEIDYAFEGLFSSGYRVDLGDGEALDSLWTTKEAYKNAFGQGTTDYFQSFNIGYFFDFDIQKWHLDLDFTHSLLDVNTDLTGRTLDRQSGFPVYRQDNLFQSTSVLSYPITPKWHVIFSDEYSRTAFNYGLFASKNVNPLWKNALILGGSMTPKSWKERLEVHFAIGYVNRSNTQKEESLINNLLIRAGFNLVHFYLEDFSRRKGSEK